MSNIIDYKIVNATGKIKLSGEVSAEKLTEAVKEEMKKGWVPQGGVQTNNKNLYQALVKLA